MTASTTTMRADAEIGCTSPSHTATPEGRQISDKGPFTSFWTRFGRARSLGLVTALLAVLLSAPAAAQVAGPPAAPVGLWQCTVNSSVYGLEMEMQVAPDGTLYARGMVIYHGLQNPFTQVEGYGDWTLSPPDAGSNQYMFTFRMFPQAQNHPIVTWYVRPAGQGIMYNLFQNPQTGNVVETQCAKFG